MFVRSHSIRNHPGQAAGLAGGAALIGALSALLLTPRRGSEVRHSLKNRSLMMKDKMKDKVHEMKQSDTTQKAAEATKETAKAATERAKTAADQTANEARDSASSSRTNRR